MRHDDRVWITSEYVFRCKLCRAVNIVKMIPMELSDVEVDQIREHNAQDDGTVGTITPQEMESDRLPFVVRCRNCKQVYAVQNYHLPDE